jgi:hypothetical protein
MWAEGQTDMRKLIVAFPNFANAPKNTEVIVHIISQEVISEK